MQTVDTSSKFIKGTFVKELRNRFLCEVLIDEKSTVCYVPSSCHLSNFLQLEGKKVLLVPTQTPNARTQYALFAVPYKRNYIILNTSIANRIIENSIHRKHFAFLGKRKNCIKEHTIENYKTDLFLPSTKTIVEIKSVISITDNAIFPTVYSERTLNQLNNIYKLLNNGYRVCFFIISLHPYVKSITIDKNSAFYQALQRCLDAGLIIKAYTSRLTNYSPTIEKEIQINYQNI